MKINRAPCCISNIFGVSKRHLKKEKDEHTVAKSHYENRSSKCSPPKFDIRHCTFHEFRITIKTLSRVGRLELQEIGFELEETLVGAIENNPYDKYFITPADHAGRRNWIEEFDALANRDFGEGNVQGYKINIKRRDLALKVLELIRSPLLDILYKE